MKSLIYIGLLAGAFYGGRLSVEHKDYSTSVKDHQWYLNTPAEQIPLFTDSNKPQLGNIEYRLEGLIDETPDALRRSFDRVKLNIQDSSRVSKTSSSD